MELYRNFNYFYERGSPVVQLISVIVKSLKTYSQSLEISIRKRLRLFFCLFSVNYLIVEALKRHDYFYGNSFKVECPTGSGNLMRLRDVSMELSRRLVSVFLPDKLGYRPCHGNENRYATDEDWNRLVLFYEYFDPESGRGCGARWENKTVSSMYHLIIHVANLYNERLLSKWSLARPIKSPWWKCPHSQASSCDLWVKATSFPGLLPRQLIFLIGILNYPFASSYSPGTKPPRLRARDTMG